MAKSGPLRGPQALSFFWYSGRLAKVWFFRGKKHIFCEQRSRMWLKRRRGESADLALDGKVDENMKNIGFLGTGGIPGLHRLLRP